MMAYKLKFNLLFLFIAPIYVFGQTNINFGSINEKSSTFKTVNYNSTDFPMGSGDSVYTYFTIMGNDWTTAGVTAPIKAGVKLGTSGQVNVSFKPNQNLVHKGLVLVESEYSVEQIVVLEGQGTFSNNYYSTTRNLSEEALKTALTTLLNNGTVSLGYNTARDNMYATIDNSGGRVECVYTGKMAAFTTRAGANNASFNCEHTYPQGFFSSSDPEKSDIHHLFPTTTTSNSRRGNDPFGIVSSPSWQDGGSKSGGGNFEPRDAQKGIVARSMMYFVLRHGDFNDGGTPFLSKQEAILRTWSNQFSVTQQEKDRNTAIFGLQKNRSPFVDYPQLLEWIAKISGTSTAAAKFDIQLSRNLRDMTFGSLDTQTIQAVLYNGGNQEITVSSIDFENSQLKLVGFAQMFPIKLAEGSYLSFRFGGAAGAVIDFDDNLVIKTNAPGSTNLKFNYKGSAKANSLEELNLQVISVYPNPAQNKISFDGLSFTVAKFEAVVYNSTGKLMISTDLNSNELDISQLPSGSYVAVINENGSTVFQSRFVKD
jgi:hypothetical protein